MYIYIYTTWIFKFPDIFGTCVLSPVLREVFFPETARVLAKVTMEATENSFFAQFVGVFLWLQWWWSHFWAPVYYSLWYANNIKYRIHGVYKPTNFTGKPCHCSYVTWRAPLRPRAQHRMGVSMAVFVTALHFGDTKIEEEGYEWNIGGLWL